MKSSEQDGPEGLWAARGFPAQSGWVMRPETKLLEGESAPTARRCEKGGRATRCPSPSCVF